MAQRGNFDSDQIRTPAKHGTGYYIQLSDGTGASGHLAAFNADGSLTDGGTGSDAFSVNGTATVTVNGSAVSYDNAVTVNGA